MEHLYSVGTWCTERQAFSPQRGLTVPSFNITLAQLRQAVRDLRRLGYSAHRYRRFGFSQFNHDNNDPMVLVERTDGASIPEIRKGWKR